MRKRKNRASGPRAGSRIKAHNDDQPGGRERAHSVTDRRNQSSLRRCVYKARLEATRPPCEQERSADKVRCRSACSSFLLECIGFIWFQIGELQEAWDSLYWFFGPWPSLRFLSSRVWLEGPPFQITGVSHVPVPSCRWRSSTLSTRSQHFAAVFSSRTLDSTAYRSRGLARAVPWP